MGGWWGYKEGGQAPLLYLSATPEKNISELMIMKFNHYRIILLDKAGFTLMEEEIKFTEKSKLRRVMMNMSNVIGAHRLVLQRGQLEQLYLLVGRNDPIADEEPPTSHWIPIGTPTLVHLATA